MNCERLRREVSEDIEDQVSRVAGHQELATENSGVIISSKSMELCRSKKNLRQFA